uniref:Protein kinase domain-containing protein n=2 Tax=Chenopodium quinoa TaxID=63459 RepID=A0A803LM47_CHEQI
MGWCYENTELLLVYEFMPNKSLDMLIFCDDPNPKVGGSMTLNWGRRHTIICGVAQAIDYLHHECSKRVLHRDIKTSNVLLDAELNARLGDFGLARTFKLGEKTHHTSKDISGTPGYMAPEIFLTGRSTTETDVYAFGVLMLEVACGKKLDIQTKDDEFRVSIIDWVWEFHKHGILTDAIDPKLNNQYDKKQAECMLALGLACCHPNPYIRPSMRITSQVLSGEVVPPDVPLEKPAFMWPANAPSTYRTLDHCSTGGIMSSSTDISGR